MPALCQRYCLFLQAAQGEAIAIVGLSGRTGGPVGRGVDPDLQMGVHHDAGMTGGLAKDKAMAWPIICYTKVFIPIHKARVIGREQPIAAHEELRASTSHLTEYIKKGTRAISSKRLDLGLTCPVP